MMVLLTMLLVALAAITTGQVTTIEETQASVIVYRTTTHTSTLTLSTITWIKDGTPRTTSTYSPTTVTSTETVEAMLSTVMNVTSTIPSTESSIFPSSTSASTPSNHTTGVETNNKSQVITLIAGISAAGAVFAALILWGVYTLWKRRKNRSPEERSIRSEPRQDLNWNGPRQPISSPLAIGNLPIHVSPPSTIRTEMSPMSSSNIPPQRPRRPASLTESIQDSMRQTPVAATRKPTRSDYTESQATDNVHHRSLSPPPLNINKIGSSNRPRPDTNNDPTALLGASYTQELADLPSQFSTNSIYPNTFAASHTDNYLQQRAAPSTSAQPTTQQSGLLRTDNFRFSDPDEADNQVRDQRRLSTIRRLDPRPESPFDFATDRAARVLNQQRRAATPTPSLGSGSRISQASAGPPPNFPLPPNPPRRPDTNFGDFI